MTFGRLNFYCPKSKIIISLLFISNFANSQDKGCWLTSKTLALPTISQDIGDTVSITNVSRWLAKNPVNPVDKEIQKIIDRGAKYFLINQTKNFITLGFLEDEGEYLAVYAYTINKSNCNVISIEVLAEETAWENGSTKTYTLFKKWHIPKRISYRGSKQNGDYKWHTRKISEELLMKNNGEWRISIMQKTLSNNFSDSLTIYAKSGLKLRSEPNLNSAVITLGAYGEVVEVFSEVGRFYEIDDRRGKWLGINYQGQIGYMFSGFLSKLPRPDISQNIQQEDFLYSQINQYFTNHLHQVGEKDTIIINGCEGDPDCRNGAEQVRYELSNNFTAIEHFSYESYTKEIIGIGWAFEDAKDIVDTLISFIPKKDTVKYLTSINSVFYECLFPLYSL